VRGEEEGTVLYLEGASKRQSRELLQPFQLFFNFNFCFFIAPGPEICAAKTMCVKREKGSKI